MNIESCIDTLSSVVFHGWERRTGVTMINVNFSLIALANTLTQCRAYLKCIQHPYMWIWLPFYVPWDLVAQPACKQIHIHCS